MICEVRDNEVILSHPNISDIVCLVRIMFQKDKVLAFTKPEEDE